MVAAVKASQDLTQFVQELHSQLAYNLWQRDQRGYTTLVANYRLLLSMFGSLGETFGAQFKISPSLDDDSVDSMHGVLDAIAVAIKKGRLVAIEEMVQVEILSDFVGHADELIAKKYYLPAAVILRAVLEERLRKLCESNSCVPARAKPTMEDFKKELRTKDVVSAIDAKDIDWMAGIGNAAAHNLPSFQSEEVPFLQQRVLAFLDKYCPT